MQHNTLICFVQQFISNNIMNIYTFCSVAGKFRVVSATIHRSVNMKIWDLLLNQLFFFIYLFVFS